MNGPMPESGGTGFSKILLGSAKPHRVKPHVLSCSHVKKSCKLSYHQHPPYLCWSFLGTQKTHIFPSLTKRVLPWCASVASPQIRWHSSLQRRLVWLGCLRWHGGDTPNLSTETRQIVWVRKSMKKLYLSYSSWNWSDEYGHWMALGVWDPFFERPKNLGWVMTAKWFLPLKVGHYWQLPWTFIRNHLSPMKSRSLYRDPPMFNCRKHFCRPRAPSRYKDSIGLSENRGSPN